MTVFWLVIVFAHAIMALVCVGTAFKWLALDVEDRHWQWPFALMMLVVAAFSGACAFLYASVHL